MTGSEWAVWAVAMVALLVLAGDVVLARRRRRRALEAWLRARLSTVPRPAAPSRPAALVEAIAAMDAEWGERGVR